MDLWYLSPGAKVKELEDDMSEKVKAILTADAIPEKDGVNIRFDREKIKGLGIWLPAAKCPPVSLLKRETSINLIYEDALALFSNNISSVELYDPDLELYFGWTLPWRPMELCTIGPSFLNEGTHISFHLGLFLCDIAMVIRTGYFMKE